MGKRVFTVQSDRDFVRAFPVMKELRPHLSFSDFREIYEKAHEADGYQIVAVESAGQIIALMGYRFLFDFVRGRHLYIDDLVSTERVRSKGTGTELLKFAEEIARKENCQSLRLCTGIENERGIEFYDRNGWKKRAFAYVKKLP